MNGILGSLPTIDVPNGQMEHNLAYIRWYRPASTSESRYYFHIDDEDESFDTKGCYSRLDNINQTVLNVIELSKALKEKSVDNVDEKENERAMDSLFIKELLNIVFSNFVLKITGVFN
ncbi:hypothetical protein GLOIN_2v1765140 [Rhizophagus irregularis DAOM 181602=DAOM 197198]|nr:hypothetical protein GLOIN_2v1765140 [Rhizophagus irregularis DAOM 181602=DAOM 197198]